MRRKILPLALLLAGLLAAPAYAGDWPTPPGDASLEWQLVGPWNTDGEADVYDIDLLEAVPTKYTIHVQNFGTYEVPKGQNAGAIEDLKADGVFVVCYIDTGAWESYWPDAKLFPKSVIGHDTGWHGERWLDVRKRAQKKFAPIIWARLGLAEQLGCDGVEGDQNNGAENNDGFRVSKDQMTAWYHEVFAQTHALGMAAVQKNGISRTADILDGGDAMHSPDALLNEECAQYHECKRLDPWKGTGKPVWEVEYRPHFSANEFDKKVCPKALDDGRFALLKNEPPDGAYRRTCG